MGENSKIILGLDLGTTSIGWALLQFMDGSADPTSIIKTGVRIFPEGLDRSRGEKPLNQERREARQIRKQGRRRSRRKRKLLNLLVSHGLLPADGTEREKVFCEMNPYALRAKALSDQLSAYEFGRVLYHLGQRRGFLSNRKAGNSDDGVVKEGISELANAITEGKHRTLGSYLASLDSQKQRQRGMYTARQMFIDEFETLWVEQSGFHNQLNEQVKSQVKDAIFYQRPLKLQKFLVGKCTFEPDRKRAPIASLVFQTSRLLQDINALLYINHEGKDVPLSIEQRTALASELEFKKEMTWASIKRAVGINETDIFNLEISKAKGLKGNQTSALLKTALKKKWVDMPPIEKEALVYDLLNIESEVALEKRLVEHWRFDNSEVQALQKQAKAFPKGYGRLSSKALRRMIPYLQDGLLYDKAAAKAYGHHSKKEYERVMKLPLPQELRNPLVERALFQLRRVVNTLIRKYGIPDVIRVELARDLKLSARQREEVRKTNSQNNKRNEEARNFLAKEFDIHEPSRTLLIKYKLWQECKHECPYTGKSICAESLFGVMPQFDIEHILPYGRSLDDSFANKTLCHNLENAQVKGSKTPFEAYTGEKYELILRRVKDNFPWKLNRFRQREIDLDSAVSRQLNDTRYIAREASSYLLQLGCKVQIGTGKSTALLRRALGLGGLLGEADKNRLDHRHHAVDAIVVACTGPGMLKRISSASAFYDGYLRIESLDEPYKGFRDDVRTSIAELIVSHKKTRKISGGLHDETVYGMANIQDSTVSVRRPISSFTTKKKLNDIVDRRIRELAFARLAFCDGDFKAAFQDTANPLILRANGGTGSIIKSVKIKRRQKTFRVPRGYVSPGGNYQLLISEAEKRGRKVWKGEVVTTFEASANKNFNRGTVNCLILHKNDLVELTLNERRDVWRVQKFSKNSQGNIIIIFRPHNDASVDLEDGIYLQTTDNSLKEYKPCLVDYNPIGEKVAGGAWIDN